MANYGVMGISSLDHLWLVVWTSLKNMKVSGGYYSLYMESHKSHVPNHQPVIINHY